MDDISKSSSPHMMAHAVAGATSGMLSAMCVHPLDTVKVHLQLQTSHSSTAAATRGIVGTLSHLVREGGLAAPYRGLPMTLVGLIPTMGIYFTTYDTFKHTYARLLGIDSTAYLPQALGAASSWITTCTATNPLWVVKVRMQTQHARNVPPQDRYRNSLHAFRSILQVEGWKGLYRGLGASLLGASLVVIQLPLYERLKVFAKERHPTEKLHPLELALCSGASMFVSALIAYPHEVLRSNLQVQTTRDAKYNGIVGTLRTIVREEGVRGLYRGLGTNLVRLVPGCAITFTLYEVGLQLLQRWFPQTEVAFPSEEEQYAAALALYEALEDPYVLQERLRAMRERTLLLPHEDNDTSLPLSAPSLELLVDTILGDTAGSKESSEEWRSAILQGDRQLLMREKLRRIHDELADLYAITRGI